MFQRAGRPSRARPGRRRGAAGRCPNAEDGRERRAAGAAAQAGDDGCDRDEAERPPQRCVVHVGAAEPLAVDRDHAPREQAARGGEPLSVVGEREVPVDEQRARRADDEDEENHARRERRDAERMGGEQAARGILGSLDESAGKIVQEVEGDADDRQRCEQIAQARDPAERECRRSRR